MTKPDRPSEGKKYSARDIERIFGDVLPAQTKDDRLDDGAASGSGAARPVPGADGDPSERWYRENRPPHHGG